MEITSFVFTLASTPNLPTQPKQHFKPQPIVPHLTELWILSLLIQLQLTELMLYLHNTLLASSIHNSQLHIEPRFREFVSMKPPNNLAWTSTYHQLSDLS